MSHLGQMQHGVECVWHLGSPGPLCWGHSGSLELLQGLMTGRVTPRLHPGRQLCSQEAACTGLACWLGSRGRRGAGAKKVPGLARLWGKEPGQHPGPNLSCIP